MSNPEQATTRARAQQREQQQIWERERSELLQQMQELTARLGALEESTRGAAGQTSAGPTSTGQPSNGGSSRKDVKPLLKSLPRFSGATGEKPSATNWTAILKASLHGFHEEDILPYLPSLLTGNAYNWYELKIRTTKGIPWNTLDAFCGHLCAYFTWEEPLDETLQQWDALYQQENESVLEYAQRIEALKLRLELQGESIDRRTQYHKFRRSLKQGLQRALLNHFGTNKFEGRDFDDVTPLITEAVGYLSSFERTLPKKAGQRNRHNNESGDLFSIRKAKGLCGHCGEGPWRPGHKCKMVNNKAKWLPQQADNRFSNKGKNANYNRQVQSILPKEGADEEIAKLAMSVSATLVQSTFVQGEILGQSLKVLVDTGSHYSFLSSTLARDLGLKIINIPPEQVDIAGGGTWNIEEEVHKVNIKLLTFKTPLVKQADFKLMPMQQHHVVLGRDFILNTLNIRSDLTITTKKGDHVLPWTTPDQDQIPVTSVQEARRLLRKRNSSCYLAVIRNDTAEEDNKENEENLLEQKFLKDHPDIFSEDLPTFQDGTQSAEHQMELEPGEEPPCAKMRRFSPKEMEEIHNQVQTLLDKNFIAPSQSPFGANVLLVKKSNGSWRMCVDYRALNKITVKDKYPLPNLHDQLQHLQQAKYFSTLDLTQGYYQIPVRGEDRSKTAFRTAGGVFQWNVMPFGLSNAPATFQRLIDNIFEPYIHKCVLVYLDDILVFSSNLEEHKQHLEVVLRVLRQHHLTANPVKSKLFRRTLKYLGVQLDGTGERTTVSPSPDAIKVLDNWPPPTNIKEVQRFLGFVNYYRQFLQDCAGTSQSLLSLLRKNVPFEWGLPQQTSFEELKRQLSRLPKLVTPDPNKSFHVYSDASDVAIGAVLEQDAKPLLYASRTLNEAEQRYSTYDKELLAIYFAWKQFKPYVWGAKKVILFCDHHSLSRLLKQKDLSSRQARYLDFFADFDFEIQYIQGPRNRADALSRIRAGPPLCCVVLTSSIKTTTIHDKIKTLAQEDSRYQQRKLKAARSDGGYTIKDDLVYWQSREGDPLVLVIPDNLELKRQIIQEIHNTTYGGHKGSAATLAFLRKHFTWSGMESDIKDFIKHCDQCQKYKRDYTPQHGFLQPLPTPNQPWEVVGIDFVTGLPKTKAGRDAILVVVDHLTKMAHAIPCQKSITSKDTADLFLQNIFRLHGLPKGIVSDRGPQFISQFWNTLFHHLGTKLHLTSAYHPQSNGLTERVNGVFLETLRIFANQQPTTWDQHLALIEFAYNNSVQTATQQTPFYLNYGREPVVPITLTTTQVLDSLHRENPTATRDFNQLRKQWVQARTAVDMAKAKMAAQANKKRRPNPYQVGDQVLLSTKKLKLKGYDFPKLCPLYVGPFQVLEVGTNTVRLQVPGSLSDNFNINRLRPYHSGGRFQQSDTLPPPQFKEGDSSIHLSLDRVLRERRTGPKRSIHQYLVSFKGYGPEHNAWIAKDHLANFFGSTFQKVLTEFRKRQRQD